MLHTIKQREQLHQERAHGLRRWEDIQHARLMAADAAKARDHMARKAKMRALRLKMRPDWRGFVERNRDELVVVACCISIIAGYLLKAFAG